MSQFYGRYTLTAGKTTPVLLPTDGVAAVVISNDSAFSVVATLEGAGSSINIPAGVADMMPVQNRSFTGNLLLGASAQLTIQNSPSNYVEINIFGIGEQIPNVYPISLNRLSNQGNSIDVQMQLQIGSTANMNNNAMSIPGQPIAPNQTCYLKSFDLLGSSATAKTKGAFTVGGLSLNVDPAALGLTYEIEVYTGGPLLHVERSFETPLQGALGQHINFNCPAMSDAVLSLNAFYYLV